MTIIGEFTKVRDVPERLVFCDTSQDRDAIREYMPTYESGGEFFDNDYDSFFVETLDGDYGEVYGMYGTVPYLDRELCRIR